MNNNYLSNAPLQILPWQAIQGQLSATHPLYALINNLKPSERHPLILARYHFGDNIISNGQWQAPSQAPIFDRDIWHQCRAFLNYSPIPIGILLNRSAEYYLQEANRTVPYQILREGDVFGQLNQCSTIQPQKRLSAGIKTLFLLPKVDDHHSINWLKKYFNLARLDHLNTSQSLGHFLNAIKTSSLLSPWRCDVIFFTKPWFDLKNQKRNSSEWYHFCQRILSTMNTLTNRPVLSEHDPFFLNLMYHLDQNHIKANAYELATLKHLFNIAQGHLPGFRPLQNESFAPIKAIETIFLEIYQLKSHWPTLLYPEHLTESHTPVYYSLICPTLPERPPASEMKRFFSQLRRIKNYIKNTFAKKSQLLPPFQENSFTYFHFQANTSDSIHSTQCIPEFDSRFSNDSVYPNHHFCVSNQFLRSSIAIQRTKKTNE